MTFAATVLVLGLLSTLPRPQHHPAPGPGPGPVRSEGSFFTGAPMSREGSGTSWLPDASSVPAFHRPAGSWELMVHGLAFPRATFQDVFGSGTRGGSALGSPSLLMAAAQRDSGPRGRWLFRAMISLDPLLEGGDGYPLLFQSGETWRGRSLVDRQHPHDAIGELAAAYRHRAAQDVDLFAYVGYPGEPALGPPFYFHRPSAVGGPDAPLGHHWQDSTHIAFGVLTAGVRAGDVKADASLFTGREPDESRLRPDRPRMDSWSARLSWNPSPAWALQVSRGELREPEAAAPGIDVSRTTASALYALPFEGGDVLSSAFVWGWNEASDGAGTHSLLAEASLARRRLELYGRLELVQKTGHDLGLRDLEGRTFPIAALTLGGSRNLLPPGACALHAGAQATVYRVPRGLRETYGRAPVSASIFLRLSPGRTGAAPAGRHHG